MTTLGTEAVNVFSEVYGQLA